MFGQVDGCVSFLLGCAKKREKSVKPVQTQVPLCPTSSETDREEGDETRIGSFIGLSLVRLSGSLLQRFVLERRLLTNRAREGRKNPSPDRADTGRRYWNPGTQIVQTLRPVFTATNA